MRSLGDILRQWIEPILGLIKLNIPLLIFMLGIFLTMNVYAKAPAVRFKRSNDLKVISDLSTKLTWQLEVEPSIHTNWEDAKAYCANQNILGLGGYSQGWRLPTISELLSIIDRSNASPALDAVFGKGNGGWFWTSTSLANESSKAWLVCANSGETIAVTTSRSDYHARCVR